MATKVIDWDGRRIPEELNKLPPCRCCIEPIDEAPQLTEGQDTGLRAALDELDAGGGLSLADVLREIRGAQSKE